MLTSETDEIIRRALTKLGDRTEPTRRVVLNLLRSGFDDVDELVELALVAKTIAAAEHGKRH